jgi:hypothetical protein
MIRNFKDIVILLITSGVLILLAANYRWRLHWVALRRKSTSR